MQKSYKKYIKTLKISSFYSAFWLLYPWFLFSFIIFSVFLIFSLHLLQVPHYVFPFPPFRYELSAYIRALHLKPMEKKTLRFEFPLKNDFLLRSADDGLAVGTLFSRSKFENTGMSDSKHFIYVLILA